MFKGAPDNEYMGDTPTLIGSAVKIEGNLLAVGNVRVEGIINGTLETDKDVTIGENAQIIADIKAQNAIIAGTVKGKIDISDSLTLKSSAKISGDINTGTISIEPGGQINGQLVMATSTNPSQTKEDNQQL